MYIIAADATYTFLGWIFLALLFGLCVTFLAAKELLSVAVKALLSTFRANQEEAGAESGQHVYGARPAVPATP